MGRLKDYYHEQIENDIRSRREQPTEEEILIKNKYMFVVSLSFDDMNNLEEMLQSLKRSIQSELTEETAMFSREKNKKDYYGFRKI